MKIVENPFEICIKISWILQLWVYLKLDVCWIFLIVIQYNLKSKIGDFRIFKRFLKKLCQLHQKLHYKTYLLLHLVAIHHTQVDNLSRTSVCCSTDTGYILLVMTSLYIDLITVLHRYCNDRESSQFFWIIVSKQITIFFACSSFCSFGNAEKKKQ